MDGVISSIKDEMEERCLQLGLEGKVLEAERLRQRTENDLLLLDAVGTCKVDAAACPAIVFCCCVAGSSPETFFARAGVVGRSILLAGFRSVDHSHEVPPKTTPRDTGT